MTYQCLKQIWFPVFWNVSVLGQKVQVLQSDECPIAVLMSGASLCIEFVYVIALGSWLRLHSFPDWFVPAENALAVLRLRTFSVITFLKPFRKFVVDGSIGIHEFSSDTRVWRTCDFVLGERERRASFSRYKLGMLLLCFSSGLERKEQCGCMV